MSIHSRTLLSTSLAGLALACVQTLPGTDDEVGGNPRPGIDGAADYAGADRLP